MSDKECAQFTTGLCLHTLFNSASDQCPFTHSIKSQQMFDSSNCIIGFEHSVLSDYTDVVKECNSKIKNLHWLLNERVAQESDTAAESMSGLIEKHPTCYFLVKNYCTTMGSKKYSRGLSTHVNVCKVCGALNSIKEQGCGHFQHGKYKVIREMREKLKKRIYRLETNI